MDQLIRQILPYLPPDASALLLNPPTFSSPQSFLPLFRLIYPFARYFIVILAFYIVWSTLAGVFGYFTRFVRFALKMGPIIGLIGWVMASSGQGSLGDVWGLVQQWTGLNLGGQAARGGDSPGVQGLKGLFGLNEATPKRRTRAGKRKSSSSTTDPLANVWDDAMKVAQGERDWQGIVQDYVQNAVGKASGLGWLFDQAMGGTQQSQKKDDQQRKKR